MEDTKLCRACNKELPLDEFHRDKKSPDGRVRKCKLCCKMKRDTMPVLKSKSVSLVAIRFSRAIAALGKRLRIPVSVKVNNDATITVTIKGETSDEE